LAHRCGIHIWRYRAYTGFDANPYEEKFQDCITIEWADGRAPGLFFGSAIFQHFAELLDEWAATDSRQLEYFGGKLLVTLARAIPDVVLQDALSNQRTLSARRT